jgi:hypothetical protein
VTSMNFKFRASIQISCFNSNSMLQIQNDRASGDERNHITSLRIFGHDIAFGQAGNARYDATPPPIFPGIKVSVSDLGLAMMHRFRRDIGS